MCHSHVLPSLLSPVTTLGWGQGPSPGSRARLTKWQQSRDDFVHCKSQISLPWAQISPPWPQISPPQAQISPPWPQISPPRPQISLPQPKSAGHLSKCCVIPQSLYVWALSYFGKDLNPFIIHFCRGFYLHESLGSGGCWRFSFVLCLH